MTAIEPKAPPKVNISARVRPHSLELLRGAARKTGKSKSELVDECIQRTLGQTHDEKGAK